MPDWYWPIQYVVIGVFIFFLNTHTWVQITFDVSPRSLQARYGWFFFILCLCLFAWPIPLGIRLYHSTVYILKIHKHLKG
jgi:hypothetical protein